MVLRIIVATICFASGLLIGAIWSKHHRPILGKFREPDGILAYGSKSRPPGSTGDTGVQDGSEANSNSRLHARDKSADPVIPGEIGRLYRTVGDDGRLTAGIRELAGIDETTALIIQEEIDNAFAKHKDLVKQNLKRVSDGTGEGPDGIRYEMSEFPGAGSQPWEELQGKIKLTAGKQAAAYLIAAFNPMEQFGGMGESGHRFTFRNSDLGETKIEVEIFKPGTDVVGTSGIVRAGRLPLWMQGLFDVLE